MPNWCVSNLSITGNAKDIEKLVAAVAGVEGRTFTSQEVLDFSRIIVPPVDDPIYRGEPSQSAFVCGCEAVFVETGEKTTTHNILVGGEVLTSTGEWRVDGQAVIRDTTPLDGNDFVKTFGARRCPKHMAIQVSDHPTFWWNWNIHNWGTKWNASDPYLERLDDTHIVYHFQTAWSPPSLIVRTLAEQHPTLSFEHSYCEGGMGYAGRAIYTGGTLLSEEEYEQEDLPEDCWLLEDDGSRSYERDYDKVPATAYERFCEAEFGGVVGG